MRKLITFFLALTTLACQKEDSYSYSGIYNSQRTEISEIRLFTKAGEIINKDKIERFIKRLHADLFVLNYDSTIDVTGKISIEFLPDSKANFTFMNNLEKRNVIETNDNIIFESEIISTQYNFTANPFCNKAYTFFPFYSETIPLTLASGFYSKTNYKHCYYTKGNKEVIEFPLLSYLYSKYINENNHSTETVKNINNEFNLNSLNDLTESDTLAIQQFRIILKK